MSNHKLDNYETIRRNGFMQKQNQILSDRVNHVNHVNHSKQNRFMRKNSVNEENSAHDFNNNFIFDYITHFKNQQEKLNNQTKENNDNDDASEAAFKIKDKRKFDNYQDSSGLEKLAKESRISKLFTESIVKKIMIMMLLIMIIFPLLSTDFFDDELEISPYNMINYYLVYYFNQNNIYFGSFDNSKSPFSLFNQKNKLANYTNEDIYFMMNNFIPYDTSQEHFYYFSIYKSTEIKNYSSQVENELRKLDLREDLISKKSLIELNSKANEKVKSLSSEQFEYLKDLTLFNMNILKFLKSNDQILNYDKLENINILNLSNETSRIYKFISNYKWENYLNIQVNKMYNSSCILKLIDETFEPVFPILNITINNHLFYINQNYTKKEFRSEEIYYIEKDNIRIAYLHNYDTKLNGLLNCLKTLYTCFFIVYIYIKLEKDTHELVLEPLEIIMEVVDNASKDPANSKKFAGMKELALTQNPQQIKISNKEESKDELELSKKNKKRNSLKLIAGQKYEVVFVQKALIKITSLLAVGVGEAGGEIIMQNLKNQHEYFKSDSYGSKIYGIFGFCSIKRFEEINLALQEQTLLYLNKISSIVHTCVDKFIGAPNKNIGEAYLCCWKLCNKIFTDDVNNLNNVDLHNIADCAVLAYLDILKRIKRDRELLKYKKMPIIQKKIKDFETKINFGLHIGWAIEGGIGSKFKVDFSYLSPNVNIASRLEAASKHYGVEIIISGIIYDLLSPEMQLICRHIDRVQVKGSLRPIDLYTIDINKGKLSLSNKMNADHFRKKEEIRQLIKDKQLVSKHYLNKDSFVELLSTKLTEEFYELFEEGLENYFGGNWLEAKKYFKKCLKIYKDQPTITLLNYIKSENYTAPFNWIGVRELKSK